MPLGTIVSITTLGVSLITLAGVAFSMGRLFGRVDSLERGQQDIAERLMFLERSKHGKAQEAN